MKHMRHYLKNSSRGDLSGVEMFRLGDVLTDEFIEDMIRDNQLEDAFYKAETMPEKWTALRRFYEVRLPEIMESARRDYRTMHDPYMVDWLKMFSPIEYAGWCSIRYYCLPLYPQFPVGRFFLDFANPYLRIAVELDGKDWHNGERDRQRDEELAKDGWQVFRIPGRECYTKHKHLYEIGEMERDGATDSEIHRELERYFYESSDGVFKAIEIFYFTDQQSDFISYAYRSLEKHRLAQFVIRKMFWN